MPVYMKPIHNLLDIVITILKKILSMIIKEPSFLVGPARRYFMAWTTCNILRLRKSDTVFTKNLRSNLRSNLMLCPKSDLMSYAEKHYPARKSMELASRL